MRRTVLVLLTAVALLLPVLPAQAAEAVVTTTTLTATAPTDRQVFLAVRVEAEDGSVPTGTVEVREGEDLVATIPLTDGSGSTETSATAGEHTYVATYFPDTPTWTASTSDAQTVNVAEGPRCFWSPRTSVAKPQIGGQKVYQQGARPTLKIKVRHRGASSSRPTGTIKLTLTGPSTRWKKVRRYDGGTLELRGPRLGKPGIYHVTLKFLADPATCAADSKSEASIAVKKRRR